MTTTTASHRWHIDFLIIVFALLTATAGGCSSSGGQDDASVGDAGSDGGDVYAPQEPTCSGTALACTARTLTDCNDGAGCERGECDGVPLGYCDYDFEADCENNACEWRRADGYCGDPTGILGCRVYDPRECRIRNGCHWNTNITECGGAARPCAALDGVTCEEQPGCSASCDFGWLLCGGACINPQVDPNHCGTCGSMCDTGTCEDGLCRCPDGSPTDPCGRCDDLACEQDCNGVWGGSDSVDMCGTCDDDASNDCVQDCAEAWGGTATEDMCGTCDADDTNDCEQDCSGTWGGTATEDMCGTCDDDASNDCDCNALPGGTATEDMCGTCDSIPSNDCVQDCAGAWGGTAAEDMCGRCDTNPSNDCVQDCSGTWGGTAAEDDCGTCDTDPYNNCLSYACAGVTAYGACWYLSGVNQSCATACGGYQYYDLDTRDVAGDEGTNQACTYVMNRLGVPGSATANTSFAFIGGCKTASLSGPPVRHTAYGTTGTGTQSGYRLACACTH